MKTPAKLCLTLACLWAASSGLRAQTYTLDPTASINDYVSVGEFNTAGNKESWNDQPGATTVSVVRDGVLEVQSVGGDPWIWRFDAPNADMDLTIVEFRYRIVVGERTQWEWFWGTTVAPYLDGGRRLGFDTGIAADDTGWHVGQIDMAGAIGGPIKDFRFDMGQSAGNKVEFDYIRIGRVMPDGDNDGLPDVAETGTGVFVDRRSTGTNPAKPDTDGDGFQDGLEVNTGTDPNDPASSPQPAIERWTTSQATYVVSVAIEPNSPIVQVGVPQSFAVSPTLPAGLNLNPTTGVISGTPTAASAAGDYTMVTTFAGGKTGTNLVNIEVRNPFIDYGAANRKTLKVGAAVSPFKPAANGPAPSGYRISPTLPDGLAMDPATGEVSGTPTAYSPATLYTTSASYAGAPDSSATVTISVLEDVKLAFDPADLLSKYSNYESIGEFDGTPDGGTRFNYATDVTEDGTSLVVTTTGDLCWVGWFFTPTNDHRVVEMRIKITAGGGQPWNVFWQEDAANRGWGHSTSPFPIPWDAARNDGQFHVYQLDFTKAMEAKFTGFRLDPGYFVVGSKIEVDYIRIGTLAPGALPALQSTIQPDGKVKVSWPASATGAALQFTAALPGGWATDPTAVESDGTTSWILVQPSGIRFYRLTR